MKKIAFLLSLLASGTAFATPPLTSCIKQPEPCPCFRSMVTAGASVRHTVLKPEGFPSYTGNLGGLQLLYEYRPPSFFYEAVKLNYSEGTVHGGSGKRHLLYFDTQARVGYTFAAQDDAMRLTAFTGFGWHFNGQDIKQAGVSDIRYYYNDVYIPVGILSEYRFSCAWSLGINATWMPQVFPTLNIEPLGGARWILNRTLGNFSIELPVTWNYTGCNPEWSLSFKPFYEFWKDGASIASTTGGASLDVASTTYKTWGAELNLSYAF